MSGRAFADSNILLYTLDTAGKAATAEKILDRCTTISVQVLNEFASVARRKKLLSVEEIVEMETTFRALFEVLPLTLAIHDHALLLCGRYSLSFYDALIAAAALEAGCTTLYSEDMQHGLKIEQQLEVVNPFRAGRG